jgi:tetratricopeptide (TPR) repeat protein/transcriptional regulator with XRE-family HTH domain
LNVADEPDGGLGTVLRQYRVAAGLTQEELAERAGLSVRALRDMERGHTRRPYRHSLRLVADALKLTGRARLQLLQAAHAGANGGGSADGRSAGAPAPEPALVVPRQLPAPARHFAGRADELMRLAALLDQPPGPAGRGPVVLTGTAGVGKTTLAVRWAHEVADRFADGQLFANLRGFDLSGTPAKPEEVIRGFLEALQVPAGELPASPAAQAGLYRSLTAQRAVLVVLDNARDADQVRPLLPGGRFCLAVVTSRNQLPGLAVAEGADSISLDVMSSADAEELLKRRLAPVRLAGEPQAVGELIALCARLPLALAIVGSRAAARSQVSLTAAAAQLRDAHARLDSLGTGEAATSVRAAFSWSYDLLPGPAARTFRLLGVHPGPDIAVPAAASLAGLPPGEAATLLRALNEAHLIEERVPGRYAFHDLLRTYAAEQALAVDGAERCRAAVARVLDHYLHTGHAAALLLYPARERIVLAPRHPGVRPESLPGREAALAWFTAEHETLLAACAQAEREHLDTHGWQLPWTMMHFLDLAGRWDELAATQNAALAAARRLGDQDGQAHAHCDLGRAHIRLGRLADAHVHLHLALGLRETLGDGAAQARIHLDIAQVATRQRRHSEALMHAELALSLYQAAGVMAGQARALNNIGWYHAQLDDFRQAEKCCAQALALNRELGNRPGAAASMDSLGYAQLRLGRYREAAGHCGNAVELFQALGDRFNQATALVHLGDAQLGDGRPAAASAAWRQALAILDDLQPAEAEPVRARLAALHHGHAGLETGSAAGPSPVR